MDKKDIIFSIFLIILILFTFLRFIKNFQKYLSTTSMMNATFSILTERKEYQNGENLKLKITNNTGKKLCFSTCFPYYLERKDEKWKSYPYIECKRDDIHNGCIEDKKDKGFELVLPREEDIEPGLHRIAVPVCVECKEGEVFKEETWFYSNEFIIK